MSWASTPDDATVRWADFRDGVNTAGDMVWLTGDPGAGYFDSDRNIRRAEYEALVQTTAEAWPEFITVDALLTKAQMIQHADTAPPVPQDFFATHNVASCPSIVVDVETSSTGTKVLQRRVNGGTWLTLTSSWTTLTYQDNTAPAASNVEYRARFSAEAVYAESGFVDTTCPI